MGWIPPFLLGASAAVAGELAAALLLYSGDGFVASLTVVLATETGALAAGLLFSRGLRPWNLDGLRYRWLLAVLSFGGASVFAGAWGLGGGFSASAPSQGLGLGLLAALPFFATGAVLGALDPSAPVSGGHGEAAAAGERLLDGGAVPAFGIAPWASLGAAAGFVLAGAYGLGELLPASLLLFCVVLVSAAALLHGWLVDRSFVVRPLGIAGSDPGATTPGGPDRLELERWSRGRPPLDLLLLRAGGRLADARKIAPGREGDADGGADPGDGGVVLPWERQVLELLRVKGGSALVVGAGTGALSAGLAEGGAWDVEAVDLRPLPDSLGTWRSGPLFSSADWEERHRGRHDAVIVNLRLLGGPGLLGIRARAVVLAAAACRTTDGLLLLGGVGRAEGAEPAPLEWLTDLLGEPPSRYRPGAGSWSFDRTGAERVLLRLGDGGGLLVQGTSTSPGAEKGDAAASAPEADVDGAEVAGADVDGAET